MIKVEVRRRALFWCRKKPLGSFTAQSFTDHAHLRRPNLSMPLSAAARAIAPAEAEGLVLLRSSESATGFVGVCHKPGRTKPYEARLWTSGRKKENLGSFSTAEEAALAYARALAREGVWGDAIALAIAAHLCGLRAHVMLPRGSDDELTCVLECGVPDGEPLFVRLRRHHYDLLVPRWWSTNAHRPLRRNAKARRLARRLGDRYTRVYAPRDAARLLRLERAADGAAQGAARAEEASVQRHLRPCNL